MRAFVELRRIILGQNDIHSQLREIRENLNDHDIQLSSIYEAIENLLDEKSVQKTWDERQRIRFKTKDSN